MPIHEVGRPYLAPDGNADFEECKRRDADVRLCKQGR